MDLLIASDHAGFELKGHLAGFLAGMGHAVHDLGPSSPDPADYPDFAGKLCLKLKAGAAERGILICGSGIGMSMAANRFKGVRAALCTDLLSAKLSRLHNDSNVLCLGARLMGRGLVEEVVKIWLETPFEGGRHGGRTAKLDQLP